MPPEGKGDEPPAEGGLSARERMISMAQLDVYLNGDYLPLDDAYVHVEDRGFNFADSLYEVTRVYNGKPFTLDRHIARMDKGAEILRLDYGLTCGDFAAIIDELVSRNETPEAMAYIQVSRGRAPRDHPFPASPEPTVFVMVKPHEPIPWQERFAGQKVITVTDLRYRLCGIKTTALLPNVLACQEARERGAWEAVLIRDGMVTEGSNTNVYAVSGGKIRTFPLVNILPGITRSLVRELCEAEDIPFAEIGFTPGELTEADEVFLTGSVAEIVPVVQVDDHIVGPGAGPITERLIRAYRRRVIDECGAYTPRV